MSAVAPSCSSAQVVARPAARFYARNSAKIANRLGLALPQQHRGAVRLSAHEQSNALAAEIMAKLPAAALAGLIATLSPADIALAVDVPPAATQVAEAQQQSLQFPSQSAPAVSSGYQLPEGTQWRYSDFIRAVENGKVERVRFSKDGSQLQLTAVDGRRAQVVLPNDPELVDTLAKNGVDISVSEGEQQGNAVSLIGNLLFPLIAFGGLFFLFNRAQGGQGGGPMGGMGGPMDFGKSKSKFQEVPETGITFKDVAVRSQSQLLRALSHLFQHMNSSRFWHKVDSFSFCRVLMAPRLSCKRWSIS